jgi:excisionase family DNA binding protein
MSSERGGRSLELGRQKQRTANPLLDGVPAPSEGDLAPGFDGGDRLLTVAQAAVICQISERQIHRMIRDGRLPVLRFGRSVRIRPKDLGI